MPNKWGLAKLCLTLKASWSTSGWNILIIFAFLESSYMIFIIRFQFWSYLDTLTVISDSMANRKAKPYLSRRVAASFIASDIFLSVAVVTNWGIFQNGCIVGRCTSVTRCCCVQQFHFTHLLLANLIIGIGNQILADLYIWPKKIGFTLTIFVLTSLT